MKKNICCISINSVAHVDFGGNGFVKLAAELGKDADVTWFLSCGNSIDKTDTEQKLKQFGLQVIHKSGEDSSSKSGIDVATDTLLLGLLETQKFDLVLLDRILKPVQTLLEKRCIPFIVVGSDGEKWHRAYHRTTGNLFITKSASARTIVKRDLWAHSSLLNLNFMPREYYNAKNAYTIDADKKNADTKTALSAAQYILVTFGNSMSDAACWRVFNVIKEASCISKHPYLLLTGNRVFSESMADIASRIDNLQVRAWQDYDQAFSHAIISIGHGGTAFVWYSIKHRIPMISIPLLADQLYNAKQNIRLGIGNTLYMSIRPRIMRFFSSRYLNSKNLVKHQEQLINHANFTELSYDAPDMASAAAKIKSLMGWCE